MVRDPFLVLSQELWSVDGHRLTVLMEPGRIKRGLGTDPSHEPALVGGRTYSLAVTALGQTARHTFRVSEPVLEAVDETHWGLVPPRAGCLDPAVVQFDRVMDSALCQDEIGVLSVQERPFRRVCHSHRTEPRRDSSRATRGAPGSTDSSSLNASKTSVATGWARLWTMTWAREDHRGPRRSASQTRGAKTSGAELLSVDTD